MLSKVESYPLDNLSIANKEIILNGPPSNLEGHILINNHNDEAIKLRNIELGYSKRNKSSQYFKPNLRVGCKIGRGEQKLVNVHHALAQTTPPGVYENTLSVGGEKRMVKMIVQSNIEIGVSPREFTFQNSKSGTVHTILFTLTNLGNVPFQIPDIKHVAALDMDIFCRAMGIAFRKTGKKGLVETLDDATENIKENLNDWCSSKIKEVGQLVEAGESMIVHLDITMSAGSNPTNDYSGLVRFWDQDISFLIKSHIVITKTKKK